MIRVDGYLWGSGWCSSHFHVLYGKLVCHLDILRIPEVTRRKSIRYECSGSDVLTRMLQRALERVMHAPMSFFDTTVSSRQYFFATRIANIRTAIGSNYEPFRQRYVLLKDGKVSHILKCGYTDIDTIDNVLIGEPARCPIPHICAHV